MSGTRDGGFHPRSGVGGQLREDEEEVLITSFLVWTTVATGLAGGCRGLYLNRSSFDWPHRTGAVPERGGSRNRWLTVPQRQPRVPDPKDGLGLNAWRARS